MRQDAGPRRTHHLWRHVGRVLAAILLAVLAVGTLAALVERSPGPTAAGTAARHAAVRYPLPANADAAGAETDDAEPLNRITAGGVERRAVKAGTDADAHLVNQRSTGLPGGAPWPHHVSS